MCDTLEHGHGVARSFALALKDIHDAMRLADAPGLVTLAQQASSLCGTIRTDERCAKGEPWKED